jgi:hypothetical protein
MSRHTILTAAGLFAALTLGASGAQAQAELDTRDYRRVDRPRHESPQNFAVELRLGPYLPNVDDEFHGASHPYADVFGTSPGVLIGGEFDWQALRIPFVGTLGPGAAIGYTNRSTIANVSSTTGGLGTVPSGEHTSLTVIPMHLGAVLRIDVLAREVDIPIVPYGKAAMGFALWSTGTDSGTSTHNNITGAGRSWGTLFALGAALQLDWLDRATALGFDEEIGVNHSYIFIEWDWNNLGTLTSIDKPNQLHVGSNNWVAGLALEF